MKHHVLILALFMGLLTLPAGAVAETGPGDLVFDLSPPPPPPDTPAREIELLRDPMSADVRQAAAGGQADDVDGPLPELAAAGDADEEYDLSELDENLRESYDFSSPEERAELTRVVGNDPFSFGLACTRHRHPLACAYTGVHHEERKEPRKAYRYFMLACELDEPRGCYAAGRHLEEGRGTAQNLTGAYAAYAKACELIEGQACLAAGRMAEAGQGVGRSIRLALEGYLKACRLEVMEGCTRTGKFFYHGIGVKKSDQLASMYFRLSCEQSDGEACYYLATLHQTGHGIPHDSAKTTEFIIKACEAGEKSGKACSVAADIFSKGLAGKEANPSLAFRFTEKACALGQAASCLQAGIVYHEGLGRSINVAKAFGYYERGCDLQLARSCVLAGMLYDMTHPPAPQGTPNRHGSWEYFGRACTLGSQEGCKFEQQIRGQVAGERAAAAAAAAAVPPPPIPAAALQP